MAEIRNFSLAGVASSLQFGKGGVKLVQSANSMSFMDSTATTLVPVSVGAATNVNHATSKSYVDGKFDNLSFRPSVKVATTANITLTGEQTVNGQAVVAGDRVLVKDQTVASENGIWIVAADAWTRASDVLALGSAVLAALGTTDAMALWAVSTTDPIVPGTTPVAFAQVSGGAGGETVTAGDGLQKVGSELSVKLDGASLVASTDGLKVSDTITGDLTTAKTNIGTLQTDLTALTGRVTTNETDIADLQTTVGALDPTAIKTADGFTAVRTTAVADQVTVDVKKGAAAERVANFAAGGPATSVATVTFDGSLVNDRFTFQAGGAADDVSLHLAPKGNGDVLIGATGQPGLIQADEGQSLTLSGGDAPTGTGGKLILKGGFNEAAFGTVDITSPAGAVIARFDSEPASTSGIIVTSGTDSVSIVSMGDEPNIDLVLDAQGTGNIAASFKRITQVTDPTNAQDAATKNYVDNAIGTGTSKVGSLQTRTTALATTTANVAGVVKGRVRRVMIAITTAYSAGATFTVGTAAAPASIVAATDFDEATVGVYEVTTNVDYAVDTQLVITVSGAPAAGAAEVVIDYVQA